MSIETIERYIQEMEAIKSYPQVKREKDELSLKVEELKVSLDNALKEVSSLKSSKANLDGVLMTLEEARSDFIRAQDTEVGKRTTEEFEKLKADYESKMPQLVFHRLRDILKQPWLPKEIAKLIDTEAEKKADAILRDQKSWPEWFKKTYEEEASGKVKDGLNKEFDARVEAAAVTRTQQRLKELINAEWPAWYRAKVEPKIAELESKIKAGALPFLKGPWVFTCNQCGTSSSAELTTEGIDQLLRTGQIKVACAKLGCEDHTLFSKQRHTFRVTLHDLIKIRITG